MLEAEVSNPIIMQHVTVSQQPVTVSVQQSDLLPLCMRPYIKVQVTDFCRTTAWILERSKKVSDDAEKLCLVLLPKSIKWTKSRV